LPSYQCGTIPQILVTESRESILESRKPASGSAVAKKDTQGVD
jgi:hypothetical protein